MPRRKFALPSTRPPATLRSTASSNRIPLRRISSRSFSSVWMIRTPLHRQASSLLEHSFRALKTSHRRNSYRLLWTNSSNTGRRLSILTGSSAQMGFQFRQRRRCRRQRWAILTRASCTLSLTRASRYRRYPKMLRMQFMAESPALHSILPRSFQQGTGRFLATTN